MESASIWLVAGGVVFAVIAAVLGARAWHRERARRARVFAERYGGDHAAVLAAAGPDECDVLVRLRRTHGDEGAAIRLRRVDKDLPFDELLTAVRTLP